ncbi:hypothetical protein OD797_19185 [Pseudomonas aeruginosa]|uniref:hypothetical protein n=1 Tax=Pseudomonas aeruginosa TaxID=287 RepID=UPI0015CD8178|nr:hypothetical protein [Pseudomonas aeruginosa]MBG4113711.1 hypothetical protein [Pseudomonas aeruginosa]MCV4348285.1 hypothetical protein [Pseudomonas aeruginosa]
MSKELNKAPVEQAGGDERAEFERAFTVQEGVYFDDKRGEYRSMNLRAIEATDAQDLNLRLQGWQARAALAQPSAALPPFAEKVLAKLRRFYDCASDFESGGVDIGRHWLDLLTQLGLLNRVQRSPAFWEISQQGEDLLEAPVAQAQHSVPEISGIGRDAEHPRAVVLYLRNEPSEEDMRAIQNFLRAISADVLTQAQHSAGYAEARMCANCQHIGINDAADYAACHDCNWTGPEPDEDKCPGCAGENCMAAACPECGGRYDLVAEANITAPAGQVPQAWLDVQAERRRQITAEGWTPDHDDLYCAAELPRAAAAYILSGANDEAPAIWPFSAKWWKPRDARSNYVRASALILAEIERLDRAAPGKEGGVAGRRHRGLST